jgi:hypothetical protein
MDLGGAMDAVDIVDCLDLHDIDNKPWHIQASNALTGDGVGEGVDWLSSAVKSKARRSKK